jgi:hypothetical protein
MKSKQVRDEIWTIGDELETVSQETSYNWEKGNKCIITSFTNTYVEIRWLPDQLDKHGRPLDENQQSGNYFYNSFKKVQKELYPIY